MQQAKQQLLMEDNGGGAGAIDSSLSCVHSIAMKARRKGMVRQAGIFSFKNKQINAVASSATLNSPSWPPRK